MLAMVLTLISTAPGALLALWLKYLVEGLEQDRPALIRVGAAGVAGSCVAIWWLRLVAVRVQQRFRMRIAVALETHVARMQATVDTVEHHERPEYLDRLAVLRESTFQLDHLYQSLFATISAAVCLGLTVGVLMTVSPWMILLVLVALPTIAVSACGRGCCAAPRSRRPRPSAGNVTCSPSGAVAWTLLGLHASAGEIILVVTAGGRLGQYVAMTAGEADFVRLWLDASRRLAWLEDYVAGHRRDAELEPPPRLREGIVLHEVSFRYPGTSAWVLRDVSLTIPADSVIAVVGENGAGKSTLVKLLCACTRRTGDGSWWTGPTCGDRAGPVAGPAGGRVPGLRPVRVPLPPQHRAGRPAAQRRPAERGGRGRPGRGRGGGGAAARRIRHPAARRRLAGRRRAVLRAVAAGGAGSRVHAGRSAATSR